MIFHKATNSNEGITDMFEKEDAQVLLGTPNIIINENTEIRETHVEQGIGNLKERKFLDQITNELLK